MLLWKNTFYRRLHKFTKAVFVLHSLPGCCHVNFTFGVSVGLGGFQNKVLQMFSNCLKHIRNYYFFLYIYVDVYSCIWTVRTIEAFCWCFFKNPLVNVIFMTLVGSTLEQHSFNVVSLVWHCCTQNC